MKKYWMDSGKFTILGWMNISQITILIFIISRGTISQLVIRKEWFYDKKREGEWVMGMGVKVRVWGDYDLFSRPEMKVERCSYDVMTPSAARGILEAIYWHPGM